MLDISQGVIQYRFRMFDSTEHQLQGVRETRHEGDEPQGRQGAGDMRHEGDEA